MARARVTWGWVCLGLLLAWQATAHAQSESGAALTAPRPNTLELAVVATATVGIDPVVGEHVTTRIALTAEALGYVLSSSDAVRDAQARLRAGSPPSPADLWRIAFLVGAERSITARAYAHEGRYVIEVVVASLDGTGPFRATATAGAEDLHAVVEGLVRQLLPPPSTWNAEAAAQLRAQATQAGPAAHVAPVARPAAGGRASRHPGRRFALTVQSDSAFGAGESRFYNHLLGARLDLRITRNVVLGAYLGYANLVGRNDRVSNLVTYLQIEDRISVMGVDGLSVPIRGGVGYVPYNGPLVRIAAGLNYAISDRFELGLDLLAPTFWFTPDARPVTFDLALEGIFRFGPVRSASPPRAEAQGDAR